MNTSQDETASNSGSDPSRIWLPAIVDRIASFLSANETACTLRLINKATAQQFSGFRIVRLSLVSPPHAFLHKWGSASAYREYSRKQRLNILELTAGSGCVVNVQIALDNAGLFETHKLLEAATAAGHLGVTQFLRARGCMWDRSLALAARGGHRSFCEWLLASGCPFRQDAVYEAACGGHEVLMYWLLRHFASGSAASAIDACCLFTSAAEGFRLAPLQRLRQQLLIGRDGEVPRTVLNREQQGGVLSAAAGSSTPDWKAKVEWLEGLGYPRMASACELAAARPDDNEATGRLRWLCSRGYPMNEWAASAAVASGNLAALRFLVQQRRGLRPQPFVCTIAAGHGHLAVLQFLHDSGFTISTQGIARSAAGEGLMAVVVWAVGSLGLNTANAPDLFDWAAKGASIQLMAWLRERGWAWGREAIPNAAEGGCEEALGWLVGQGCPWPADGRPYRAAARHGDLATVLCLHRLGCPWGPNQLADCIRFGAPVPVLRLLLELGCPADWDAAAMAADARDSADGRAAALEWVTQERRKTSPAEASTSTSPSTAA